MQQRHRLQRNLFEEDRRTLHIPGAEGPPLREDAAAISGGIARTARQWAIRRSP
jgi:hypothetical protein